MDRLIRDYKLEEGDPCSKLIETDSMKRLEAMKAIVQSYDEDKESIATGLLDVKRNADSFLSTIAPLSSERPDITIERVKESQEQLKAQEQQVLEVWNVRRTLADYCLQFLELEQCAKEVCLLKRKDVISLLQKHLFSGKDTGVGGKATEISCQSIELSLCCCFREQLSARKPPFS